MIKKRFISMLVLLMTAVSGAWAKNYYNVTFSGFYAIQMNTTVTTTLPQTFEKVGSDNIYPWSIVDYGDEFTNVVVTNNGNGMVSASMINWGAMSITVSGAFNGNATIQADISCLDYDLNKWDTSAEITVQCVFAYEAFDVTYDANGGSGAPSAQEKRTGIDLTLSSTQPTRDGYTFAGWNTAQDGSGDSYAPGATYTANADVTLYAQWTAPEPATVAVTGVTLAPTTATLTLGETETVTLIPTVLPAEATDKTVTWTTSDASVATVADGVVTAVAPGTATITATATNGTADTSDDKTATCEVTVSPAGYSVALKEGTDDASNWQGKAGEGEYQALPLEGVAAGTAVSVKYSGTKKVKSVKAVKKAAPAAKAAAEATAEDKGKLIGTNGKIYADVAAATAAGTTAVAKIIYIGTTGHATYSHGLALALTDEGQMTWESAKTACNTTKNTSTPVTDATWLLASKEQWDYMMGTNGAGSYNALRDGFTSVGGSNLVSNAYWSSTESGSDAWYYYFDEGYWNDGSKDYGDVWVRACLAF